MENRLFVLKQCGQSKNNYEAIRIPKMIPVFKHITLEYQGPVKPTLEEKLFKYIKTCPEKT